MTIVTPRVSRASLSFILVTVTLDVLALGIVTPVLPSLVAGFVGGNLKSAAGIVGNFGVTWAVMQFIASPLLGAISDRFGRRPVILISNIGLGLDYVLIALAPTLTWIFVGRVISGIAAASVTTAGAYIADVTPPEKRAASLGMLGGAFSLGFVLGPALGGALGEVTARLPFWAAAALSLINAGYELFVLPESLPLQRRLSFCWRRANPIGALASLLAHRDLPWLAASIFLDFLAYQVLPAVFVLYAMYRFDWSGLKIGLTLAAMALCTALAQARLVRPIVEHFGERTALLSGLCCGALGLAVYGFASNSALFWLGIPIMSLWGLAEPANQALMTSHVSEAQQGQLQGTVSALRGLSGVIGPKLFTLIFAASINGSGSRQFAGTPFLLSALLLLIALALVWRHVGRANWAHRPFRAKSGG